MKEDSLPKKCKCGSSDGYFDYDIKKVMKGRGSIDLDGRATSFEGLKAKITGNEVKVFCTKCNSFIGLFDARFIDTMITDLGDKWKI
jgi:hypothetical protein